LKTAAFLTLLAALTTWLVFTAVRIERLNAAAGNFLPRHDEGGKWRMSLRHTAHDQLREAVGTIGLGQYVLAPAVVILGAGLALRHRAIAVRAFVVCTSVVAFVCLGCAWYRGYFASLSW